MIVDRKHHIPYVAGYSKDAHIIYIDKRLPRHFKLAHGGLAHPDQYLIIHETLEKAVEDTLHMVYPKSHDLATLAERAAVEKDGINWKEYQDWFAGHYEHMRTEFEPGLVPRDLSLEPYRGMKDFALIKKMGFTP